jgi:hypothetical protein
VIATANHYVLDAAAGAALAGASGAVAVRRLNRAAANLDRPSLLDTWQRLTDATEALCVAAANAELGWAAIPRRRG